MYPILCFHLDMTKLLGTSSSKVAVSLVTDDTSCGQVGGGGEEGAGIPGNLWWGCAARFSKS